MKKLSMVCRAAPLLLVTGGPAQAQDVLMVFRANIVETTCTMKVTGGSGDGQNNTLKIGTNGKVGLDKLIAGDQSATTATFSLDIVECPSSLNSLKTSVNGAQSGFISTLIKNGIAAGQGGADYVGVSIARSSALDNSFTINSVNDNERLVWTASEIQSKKVNLTARLMETQANSGTTGQFRATATFAFTYE